MKSQHLTQQAKWQQRVDHQIDVELFPQNRCIIGQSQIIYHNQSPDTLNEIYFHLYPNAYSHKNSSFAKQQLRNGKRDFHYSSDSSLGYIKQLDFKVNDKTTQWQYDSINSDIALIKLNQPLLPGDSIKIS
ncbi:MAG: hypothetical protein WD512_04985, partial [Candidatus Paceibacterota bacterium]